MDFLKENWVKITIASLAFLAGLVYIIALVQTDAKVELFKGHAVWIAGLTFFFGLTAYLVCKLLEQDWAKYVLLGVGVIATIFAMAYLVHTIDTRPKGIFSFFEWLAVSNAFTILVVFGLIPLIKGVKKVLCCDCNGSEKKATVVAAPAPKAEPVQSAAPTAAPKAAGPKVAAPKAPAK